ncbi:hypothetical protein [Vibrio rumoiensis]|uniref:Uncharacterized protein n=1 Tax=Vibrio rumoiensis 1S-45 TaxID=1188252 RepID=A0A1E5E5V0_9VIBR|nr:hypothetical protein [Vibrio rumoiensis]OEF29407.1 hypothetical protein A1QC_03940 [Vibrio rumoiensis 1S-45]
MMGEYQTKQGVLVEIFQGQVRIAMGGLVVTDKVENIHAITINALDGSSSFYLAVDDSNALLFVEDLAELEAVAQVLGIEVEKG